MTRTFLTTGLFLLMFVLPAALTAQKEVNPFDLSFRQARVTDAPAVEDTVLEDTALDGTAAVPLPEDTASAPLSELVRPAVDSPFKEVEETGETGRNADRGDTLSDAGDEAGPAVAGDEDEWTKKRQSYLLLIMLAVAILSTLVISFNRSIVQRIWRALLNDNFLNLVYREEKTGISFQYIFLYFIFFVNAGLFLYLTFRLLTGGEAPVLWKAIAFIALVYAVRHLFMQYLISIYPFSKEAGQYNFTILIFNLFLGLLLLPVNAFVAFAPETVSRIFMYAGLVMAGLLYIFRLLRGLFIGSRFLATHKFHFFIYLCATEIAPIFLIIKFFQKFLI